MYLPSVRQSQELLTRAEPTKRVSVRGEQKAGAQGQQLHRNVQRSRGGLVFKAHRLCVSLNSRLASNNEEGRRPGRSRRRGVSVRGEQKAGAQGCEFSRPSLRPRPAIPPAKVILPSETNRRFSKVAGRVGVACEPSGIIERITSSSSLLSLQVLEGP